MTSAKIQTNFGSGQIEIYQRLPVINPWYAATELCRFDLVNILWKI